MARATKSSLTLHQHPWQSVPRSGLRGIFFVILFPTESPRRDLPNPVRRPSTPDPDSDVAQGTWPVLWRITCQDDGDGAARAGQHLRLAATG